MTDSTNPTGLRGIRFVELASKNPEELDAILLGFGFSRVQRLPDADVVLYRQGVEALQRRSIDRPLVPGPVVDVEIPNPR